MLPKTVSDRTAMNHKSCEETCRNYPVDEHSLQCPDKIPSKLFKTIVCAQAAMVKQGMQITEIQMTQNAFDHLVTKAYENTIIGIRVVTAQENNGQTD